MTMRVTKRSDPEGEALYTASEDLAKAMNPQCWYDLAGDHTMATPERLAGIDAIKSKLGSLLDGGIFRDHISKL